MKSIAKYFWLILIAVSLLSACGDDKSSEGPSDNFDVQFDLPASIDVVKGGGNYTFSVKEGKTPQTTDSFILESEAGVSSVYRISQTTPENFTVTFTQDLTSGYYRVSLKRDTRKKQFGKTYINIVDGIITPDAGTTVYGVVSSAEGRMPNVVVSDGEEVTTTDKDGIYQLKSTKKWGRVFISIPGGYEVPSDGVLPQFHYKLKGAPNAAERVDFTLKKVDNQDSYKIFLLGDMHLANRTGDAGQFAQFTSDLTSYMNAHKGTKMYALTLGDMTWDLYWYSNNFYFPEYLTTVNKQIKDLQIFHTMGNHDNDFKARSDYEAEVKYMENIAPTFYSFNIGKVHYIVLDNIDCSLYDGTDKRNYLKRLANEQLTWLAKDLAYVPKTTPLVVAMHAQIFYPSGVSGFKIDHDAANTNALFNILDGYDVNFVTGHTHMTFNVTPEASIVGGRNFQEHNSGSVCASWWWSGNLTPGVHISVDGSPGGYTIWDVSGTDFKRVYKATGWPEDYQFRSYDLNNVHFSMADVPQMPSSVDQKVKDEYLKYVNAYPANSNNEVLINIWNWNADWTLSVVDEKGTPLTYTAVRAFDPLHIAALSVKRFNNASLSATPSFITEEFTHFFKVKMSDPDTDLTITVKDEFGNTWTENMQRPKVFSTDAYKQK